MAISGTPGILQNTPPEIWSDHHFGLPPDRRQALAGHGFWVIGAGTGFGQATAVALALTGARVFLTGRRRERLEETAARAAACGADPALCRVVVADACDEAAVRRAAEEIAAVCAAERTPFRGLVHCAAAPPPPAGPGPLRDLDPARWDALMRVNLTAPWLTTRTATPLMTAQGGARVVLFTSEAGWASTPTVGPYNVSKAALNSLGASLAAEFAALQPDDDIQINVLIPGEARSEMNQGSTESPFTAACMTLLLLSHPPGGPNGRFFHRDGRHFAFAYAFPWHRSLTAPHD